jgi:hypothetical protein
MAHAQVKLRKFFAPRGPRSRAGTRGRRVERAATQPFTAADHEAAARAAARVLKGRARLRGSAVRILSFTLFRVAARVVVRARKSRIARAQLLATTLANSVPAELALIQKLPVARCPGAVRLRRRAASLLALGIEDARLRQIAHRNQIRTPGRRARSRLRRALAAAHAATQQRSDQSGLHGALHEASKRIVLR